MSVIHHRALCRTCLKSSSLEPLFPNPDQLRRFEMAFYLSTGLQIKPNDGLPQTICKRCSKHIENAMKFRLKCQNAEKRLLEVYKPSHNIKSISEETIQVKEESQSEKDNEFNSHSTSPLHEQKYRSSDEEVFDRIQLSTTTESKNEKSDRSEKVLRKQTYSRKRALELVKGPLKQKQPIQCKLCQKMYKTFNTFEKHAMSHLGYNILCEFCGGSFISPSSLLRHQVAKHGMEKDNRFMCSFCDFRAIDKEQLEVHVGKVHTKERSYICDDCGASFFTKRVLIQHTVNHRDDKPFQCDMCPSKFKLRNALTGHTKRVHRKGSCTYIFGCHICSKRYCSTGDTRKHLLKVHGIPVEEQGKVHRFYLFK